MWWQRGCLVLSLTAASTAVPAAQPPYDAAVARTLTASTLDDGQSLRDVTALTEIAGARLTGTATYERAAAWAVGQFREAGIGAVALEPFAIGRGWQRESARGRMVAPVERPLQIASLGWMPSTPDGGIEAEVVIVRDLRPEKIAAQTSLRGRIALLPEGEPYGSPYDPNRGHQHLDADLLAAGVLAILSPDGGPGNELSARWRGFNADLGALPAAQIGRDDALDIRERLERGPVRVALDLRNRVSESQVMVPNVVAEIRGREAPGEWVLVGAHLDAWDFATGAQDNATGVIQVLAAARAIAALPRPPRRSIRFVLFGGEEQGQLGSAAYVTRHEHELDGEIAMLNTDAGAGRTIGWTSPGRSDVARALQPFADALLTRLHSSEIDQSLRYAFQSDGAPFLIAGIPMLDLNADDAAYEDIHHKVTDTTDRVDAHNVSIATATVAVTAWSIADAPSRIAPRLDRRAIQRLLGKED
jgi:carboxypeptidase Q